MPDKTLNHLHTANNPKNDVEDDYGSTKNSIGHFTNGDKWVLLNNIRELEDKVHLELRMLIVKEGLKSKLEMYEFSVHIFNIWANNFLRIEGIRRDYNENLILDRLISSSIASIVENFLDRKGRINYGFMEGISSFSHMERKTPSKFIEITEDQVAAALREININDQQLVSRFCDRLRSMSLARDTDAEQQGLSNLTSSATKGVDGVNEEKKQRSPIKKYSTPQPRLSKAERELAQYLISENLPRWIDKRQRNDELASLSAPLYFARVYAEFMGPNLTRKVLKAVDPELTSGISNWQRDHGGQLPSDVVLPNELTTSRKWVEQLKTGNQSEELDPAARTRNGQRERRAASRERQQ